MKNSRDIKIMMKEAGILFAITLIAGLVLGFVYELTKEPIRLQKEKAIQEACSEVFDTASSFQEMQYHMMDSLAAELSETGVTIGKVYMAQDTEGKTLGYVLQTTSSQGYGGDITLYMGVLLDGTLNGVSILSIAETPGLGMKAESKLLPQFKDKKVSAFTYTKSGSKNDAEIDAISGATITTEAFVNAVNGGLRAVTEDLLQTEGGNGQ